MVLKLASAPSLRVVLRVAQQQLIIGIERHDQPFQDRFLEIGDGGGQRLLADQRQQGHIEAAADARGPHQSALRACLQLQELAGDKLDHIIGRERLLDAVEIPAPAAGDAVEDQQAIFVEQLEELIQEERIPSVFVKTTRASRSLCCGRQPKVSLRAGSHARARAAGGG